MDDNGRKEKTNGQTDGDLHQLLSNCESVQEPSIPSRSMCKVKTRRRTLETGRVGVGATVCAFGSKVEKSTISETGRKLEKYTDQHDDEAENKKLHQESVREVCGDPALSNRLPGSFEEPSPYVTEKTDAERAVYQTRLLISISF